MFHIHGSHLQLVRSYNHKVRPQWTEMCSSAVSFWEGFYSHSSDAQGYQCWERAKCSDHHSFRAVLHETLDFQTVQHGVALSIYKSHDMIQEDYQNFCTVLFSLASSIPGHSQNSMNCLENTQNALLTLKERTLGKF